MNRSLPAAAIGFFALAIPCLAGWKDDVGFTALQARLGASTPTGAGIIVTHAEAPSSGNYLPDTSKTEFTGKNIMPMSGASGISSHATTVGLYFYGLVSSLSPGISTVRSYNANHWTDSGLLRYWSGLAPATEVARVQNHSWIGTTNDDEVDTDLLRRIDWVVDRDGVVTVAGVNNGRGSALPKLLCSAYNVVAVGLTNGNSSYGPTRIEGLGRVKPDLVAPSSQTSYGTPMVASAAALLCQALDDGGGLSDLPAWEQRPAKALLIRTLLMAGATKAEFPDWRKGFATPVTDGTVPLDYRYGAGELNVDNSHRILSAGRQPGGTIDVTGMGWDFAAVSAVEPRQYAFEIPVSSYAPSMSVLIVWNRRITSGSGNPLVLTPALANIDLRLLKSGGVVAGEQVDASVSPVDNVEHLFLGGLRAGRYVIEVTSDAEWTYAIAWDIQLASTPPGDLDGDGDVDLDDMGVFGSCATGPSMGPAIVECSDADFDGDSDVDQTDFGMLQLRMSKP